MDSTGKLMNKQAKTDWHNNLMFNFVHDVGRNTDDAPELCVVIESILLAAITIMHKRDGVKPSVATEMINGCLDAAIRRHHDTQ
jgi:hypothetical protein